MNSKLKAVAMAVIVSIGLAGCGKTLVTENHTYSTYGLVNAASAKSDKVCYEVSIGNTIWSVLLVESLVFPAYFVGFSIMNPVRLKKSPDDKCGADF